MSKERWRPFERALERVFVLVNSHYIEARQELGMGDKSPKSKQRDQKQKDATKAKDKTKKDAVAEAGRAVVKKK